MERGQLARTGGLTVRAPIDVGDWSMYPQNKAEVKPDEPLVYQIRLQGHLRPQWSAWFADLTITQNDNGETLITGPVADQAALHGLLRKVRDLGMTLISVMQVETHQKESN